MFFIAVKGAEEVKTKKSYCKINLIFFDFLNVQLSLFKAFKIYFLYLSVFQILNIIK